MGTIAKHEPAVSRALGYRGFQVLSYVRDTISVEGQAPSYGQIRDQLGFMTNAEVCKVVRRLERHGLLYRVNKGEVRSGANWNKPILRLPPA